MHRFLSEMKTTFQQPQGFTKIEHINADLIALSFPDHEF